jgi:hypothetical protein
VTQPIASTTPDAALAAALARAQRAAKGGAPLDGDYATAKASYRYPSAAGALAWARALLNAEGLALAPADADAPPLLAEGGLPLVQVAATLLHEGGGARRVSSWVPLVVPAGGTLLGGWKHARTAWLKYLALDVLAVRGEEDDEEAPTRAAAPPTPPPPPAPVPSGAAPARAPSLPPPPAAPAPAPALAATVAAPPAPPRPTDESTRVAEDLIAEANQLLADLNDGEAKSALEALHRDLLAANRTPLADGTATLAIARRADAADLKILAAWVADVRRYAGGSALRADPASCTHDVRDGECWRCGLRPATGEVRPPRAAPPPPAAPAPAATAANTVANDARLRSRFEDLIARCREARKRRGEESAAFQARADAWLGERLFTDPGVSVIDLERRLTAPHLDRLEAGLRAYETAATPAAATR